MADRAVSDYLRIIQEFARSIELPEYALENATRLARGRLPFVIVLQEPCNTADTMPYQQMVYGDETADGNRRAERFGSPTLQEVESLVKEESEGQYGLEDVSILDLHPVHSRRAQAYTDAATLAEGRRAFVRALWKKVREHKSVVIVVLTCKASDTVQVLESSMKNAGTSTKVRVHFRDETRRCTIIKGFHPSTYLRNDYNSEWSVTEINTARAVLRHCFRLAFKQLLQLPDNRISLHNQEQLLQTWRDQVRMRQQVQSMTEGLQRL